MKKSYKTTQVEDSLIINWNGMVADSEGSALNCVLLNPIIVSFEGDFDGANVVMEGKIENKWFPLSCPDSRAIYSGSEEGLHIYGRYPYIRPRIINGGNKTNISVFLFCDTIPKRKLGR